MNDLAPIGLSTYSRVNHLKKTVEALQKNDLADKSELHIFSDAPKKGDEAKVQAVRDYLKTINGFKHVYIYEREENNRVANNRGGIKMLLENHGKIIFLEEDAVVDLSFLCFMNNALNCYEKNQNIFAITGYSPPLQFSSVTKNDVFLSKRMTACAFGIWKSRFDEIDMNISKSDFNLIMSNRKKRKDYCQAGSIILGGLMNLSEGKFEGLDIRIDHTLYKKGKYILRPVRSLVHPIGHDGTGENWTTETNKFDVTLTGEARRFIMPDKIEVNKDCLEMMRKFYSMPLKAWILVWFKYLGWYDCIKKNTSQFSDNKKGNQ